MKTVSKLIFLSVFTVAMATFTSCKDKATETDEMEITDDTISTKEELSTTATDTVIAKK